MSTGQGQSRSADLEADVAARTDSYFKRTRDVVARFGDKRVTYAVFLRRPVISAPRLMLDWLDSLAERRGTNFEYEINYPEASWVGADSENTPEKKALSSRSQTSGDASAPTQTDGTGQRSSLARMASAVLVRRKGLGLALCSAR